MIRVLLNKKFTEYDIKCHVSIKQKFDGKQYKELSN